MSARATRCEECRTLDRRYCEHHGVLVVYLDAAPVVIVSESEERARLTADRVSIAFRGRPFHQKKHERSSCQVQQV